MSESERRSQIIDKIYFMEGSFLKEFAVFIQEFFTSKDFGDHLCTEEFD